MLRLKLQYFGHLMWRVDSLEKTLMLGGIGGRRRRGQQRMGWLDGITDWWAWVWVNSGSWWWTGRPGVLRFMGLKSWTRLSEWTDSQLDFPGGSDGRESPHNEGDLSSIPGSGRSPGEGNGYPLQYSSPENSMDRRSRRATVHGVTNSSTLVSD